MNLQELGNLKQIHNSKLKKFKKVSNFEKHFQPKTLQPSPFSEIADEFLKNETMKEYGNYDINVG